MDSGLYAGTRLQLLYPLSHPITRYFSDTPLEVNYLLAEPSSGYHIQHKVCSIQGYWVNGYEILFKPWLLSGGEESNSGEMSKPLPIGVPLSESGAKQPVAVM